MAEEVMYKGRPIVRCKDTMYYGRMGDPYVVMLQVKSHKDFKDLTLSDAISVQLMATDLSLPPQKLILKRADKQGLYNGHCGHLAGSGRESKLKRRSRPAF